VVRDTLRVIAGRCRGHAGRRVRGLGQALQLQAAAAVLERTRELHVLELQEQPGTDRFAQSRRLDGGRANDVCPDRRGSVGDVLGCDLHRGRAA
jgi:hypothetical protein